MVLTRKNTGLRIGLTVDHPLRDLDGLVLVAHHLARAGHSAILVPFYAQNFELDELQLDVLVVNYIRPANESFIRSALAMGIRIAVLDTEGALRPTIGVVSYEGSARYLHDIGFDREICLYMLWGEALQSYLLEHSDLPSERTAITGCPRFDLAHRPWSKASDTGRIVLVNTAFPAVNSRHAVDGKEDREALRSIGLEGAAIDDLLLAMHAVMDRFCDAVDWLATQRPEMPFVLRPHPFEDPQTYIERFAHLANVVVRQRGNVLDAIADAAVLIHLNCTTAIEAVLSGVPPVSLEFANDIQLSAHAPLPAMISHSANSKEQALALVDRGRSIEVGEELARVRSTAIGLYFGESDGRSALRVASAIVAAVSDSARPSARARPIRSRMMGLAGRLIGSARIERMRQRVHPQRRVKSVCTSQVVNLLHRFQNADFGPACHAHEIRSSFGAPLQSIEISLRDR